MTEHKYTDDEIIRALEEELKTALVINHRFEESNDTENPEDHKFIALLSDTIKLINRQKAEIERLKAPRFMVTPPPIAEDNLTPLAKLQKVVIYDEPLVSFKRIDEEGIKAEAIKEFAERLKGEMSFGRYIQADQIDKLVKEMTEGK